MAAYSPIRAVIFDLDGTILDSETVSREISRPIIRKHIGRDLSDNEFEGLKGKVWTSIFEQWVPGRGLEIHNEIVEAWDRDQPPVPAYPGIAVTLHTLRKMGLALAIVTSRDSGHVPGMLKQNHLKSYFDTLVGQEETTRHKPFPDPFLLAASELGIPASECLSIGDQPGDIIASRAAGIRSGAALWGEGRLEQLSGEEPDHVFREPHDIIDFLNSGDGWKYS